MTQSDIQVEFGNYRIDGHQGYFTIRVRERKRVFVPSLKKRVMKTRWRDLGYCGTLSMCVHLMWKNEWIGREAKTAEELYAIAYEMSQQIHQFRDELVVKAKELHDAGR